MDYDNAATQPASGLEDFFASTPSFDVPIPSPEIHQGEITGVIFVPNNSGEGGRFQIGLKSSNTGAEADYSFFPPLPFVEDIYTPKENYSTEKPINEETGKVGLSESEVYAMHIQNSQGTATLQNLTKIAASQGHTINGEKPTTVEELAESLTGLLAGVQVVFTRSVDQNPRDPQYATVLRVRRILDPEVASNPKRMKYYENNKYKIAWL